MKNSVLGFSIIELMIVLFISGLTLASLTHMLLLSFKHYDFINEDNIKRRYIDNIRIGLRDYIGLGQNIQSENIKEELAKSINFNDRIFINELNLIKRNNDGYFIKVSICYDKNGNKQAEKEECDEKLFFFRRMV